MYIVLLQIGVDGKYLGNRTCTGAAGACDKSITLNEFNRAGVSSDTARNFVPDGEQSLNTVPAWNWLGWETNENNEEFIGTGSAINVCVCVCVCVCVIACKR